MLGDFSLNVVDGHEWQLAHGSLLGSSEAEEVGVPISGAPGRQCVADSAVTDATPQAAK